MVKLVDLIMFKVFKVRSKKKGSNGKEEDARKAQQSSSSSRGSANDITVKKWKNDQNTMKQDLQGSAESIFLKSQNEKEEKRAFKADYNSSDGPNPASTGKLSQGREEIKLSKRYNLQNKRDLNFLYRQKARGRRSSFDDKERVARNPRYCQSKQLLADQQSANVSTWPNQNSSNSYRQRWG